MKPRRRPSRLLHACRRYGSYVLLSGALVVGPIVGKLRSFHGGEYFNIARALAAGQGYANPFGDPTGPTSWMAPGCPGLLAGLYLLADNNRDAVTWVLAVLHTTVLVGTGVLVLAVVRDTAPRIPLLGVAILFFLATLYHHRYWFEVIDDCWLMLLCLDIVIGGLWLLSRRETVAAWKSSALWGFLGGVCALMNPIIGFAWGIGTLIQQLNQRTWSRLVITFGCAVLAVAPWMVRNYLVFGRFIPIKSNLAFELYQSQCLQADGLLQGFYLHPAGAGGPEGQEYRRLGERDYLDLKWKQFCSVVRADHGDFLERLATRFAGITVWYIPFRQPDEAPSSWAFWLRRAAHPLPFVAMLFLAATSAVRPLSTFQWSIIGVYMAYLFPYILASYYERYGAPLLALKVLLVVWALDRIRSWRRASA